MAWRFDIHHVPGRSIPASDATSRNPDTRVDDEVDFDCASTALAAIRMVQNIDDLEISVVAAARSSLPIIRAVTWERVRDETSHDVWLMQLIDMAEHGFPASPQLMPPQLLPYWRFKDDLSVVDGVLMYGLRAVIPPKLRDEVISHLHSAHQGVSQMTNRANECVFWPGITSDIQRCRSDCNPCDVNAPSQSKLPPAEPFVPTSPFQAVATDYLSFQGKKYLLTVDRFSNWPDLREVSQHSPNSGADGLIDANRELFGTFGVPEELSSDGGPEFTSKKYQDFLKTWGVKHRLSSAYNAQSNGRAEVTVKAMKRLLTSNVGQNGSLNTDAVTRGILQLRNTPESDSGLSPAQILLGRSLRDALPLIPPIPRFTSIFDDKSAVNKVWKDVWSAKEQALKSRLAKQVERLEKGSHELKPLSVGDMVRVQNQTGSHPNKWDKTGVVMQVGGNNQYLVRIDGSRRLTLRNRQFLRKLSKSMPIQNSIGPSNLVNFQPESRSNAQLPVQPLQTVKCQSELSHQQPYQLQPALKPLISEPSTPPSSAQSPEETNLERPSIVSTPQHDEQSDADEFPRRSQRERKKPDWFGNRV